MKRSFDSLSIPAAAALMEEVLASGNRFRFIAHGVSMSPFIRDGDTVEVDGISRLRRGDVVVAMRGGKLLVHRAICIKKDAVLLKGDHLSRADGWVPCTDVLGKIVAVKHLGVLQPLGVTRFCGTVAAFSRWGLLPAALRIYAKVFKKLKKKS